MGKLALKDEGQGQNTLGKYQVLFLFPTLDAGQ
jgi:hypothetical protein